MSLYSLHYDLHISLSPPLPMKSSTIYNTPSLHGVVLGRIVLYCAGRGNLRSLLAERMSTLLKKPRVMFSRMTEESILVLAAGPTGKVVGLPVCRDGREGFGGEAPRAAPRVEEGASSWDARGFPTVPKTRAAKAYIMPVRAGMGEMAVRYTMAKPK